MPCAPRLHGGPEGSHGVLRVHGLVAPVGDGPRESTPAVRVLSPARRIVSAAFTGGGGGGGGGWWHEGERARERHCEKHS